MSDFIFSADPGQGAAAAAALRSIYRHAPPRAVVRRGPWGSLAVTAEPGGHLPLREVAGHLVVVLGSPRVAGAPGPGEEALARLAARWLGGGIDWTLDVDGAFAALAVETGTGRVRLVTDALLFIPVWRPAGPGTLWLGTHPDALARASGRARDLDPVGLAEFLARGRITYPFTAYRTLRQCSPAAEHDWPGGPAAPAVRPWWQPPAPPRPRSFEAAAAAVRAAVEAQVAFHAAGPGRVAHFLSGGEDSRVVAALLPPRLGRDAVTLVDAANRESRTAARVARALDARPVVVTRAPLHLLAALAEAAGLAGTAGQATHAHAVGLHGRAGLAGYKAVFGGLFFDVLLKAIHAPQRRRPVGNFGLLAAAPLAGAGAPPPPPMPHAAPGLRAAVAARGQAHLERLEGLGLEDPRRWFEVWPITMRPTLVYHGTSRRLFRAVEPVLSTAVVLILTGVPTAWLLNRRLFRRAFGDALGRTRWLRSADGRLPAFSWRLNAPLAEATRLWRRAAGAARRALGRPGRHEGPWCDMERLARSPELAAVLENAAREAAARPLAPGLDLAGLLRDPEAGLDAKLRALQLLHVLGVVDLGEARAAAPAPKRAEAPLLRAGPPRQGGIRPADAAG